ncbi:MAG: methyltransferase domain-containing protein [Nanoarchaeota archaeon]
MKNYFRSYSDVKIIRAEAQKLSFEDKTFDFIIRMGALANFGKSKFKVLSEMKRVLKNNGKILISVFSEDAFLERMKMYKKINFPIKKIEGTTVFFDDRYGEGISEQFSEK